MFISSQTQNTPAPPVSPTAYWSTVVFRALDQLVNSRVVRLVQKPLLHSLDCRLQVFSIFVIKLLSAIGHLKLRSIWAALWKLVYICAYACKHSFVFLCDCVDLCACWSAHLHGNEMTYLASTFSQQVLLGLCGLLLRFWFCYLIQWGFSQPYFFLFLLTVFFTFSGVPFHCCFISLKSLFLTLDLATKRQEHSIARCTWPVWTKGILSTPSPCLCSDSVALFEIASCKDNCASRCCNKLMTVLTLKLGSTYSE